MKTLHYAGRTPEDKGIGWATVNDALYAELSKYFQMTDNQSGADVCVSVLESNFRRYREGNGRINFGIVVFEDEIPPHAVTVAKEFDMLFTHSTWCIERMKEEGIENVRMMRQGVDHSIFHPVPPRQPDGQFRIFSGGKFEWRKGHDLIICAFREFLKTNPDAHLVCCWWNEWPEFIGPCTQSRILTQFDYEGEDQLELFRRCLVANKIPKGSFTLHPKLCHSELAAAMQGTDIGLFPNRCEGGTNLVLMEYLACGKRAVANLATGQADLMGHAITSYPVEEDASGWAIQDVAEIVKALESARRSDVAGNPMLWTWEASARAIVDAVADLTGSPGR